MKRSIMVTWTCSEQIEIDIADCALTRDEINAAVDKAAENILPGGGDCCDNWETEWLSQRPKAKGEGPTPPDDYWFEAAGYTVATNGYALIVKGCEVEFTNRSFWRKVPDESIPSIEKWLGIDFDGLPLHHGYFANCFAGFKGCKVIGKTPDEQTSEGTQAYVLNDNGKLIAVLMPVDYRSNRDPEKYFQFNHGT